MDLTVIVLYVTLINILRTFAEPTVSYYRRYMIFKYNMIL